MSTLERAVAIAAEAHAGQVDKAGEPYLLHPLRVMLAVGSEEARIAAVLHDVVEDTPWTLEQLREEGFSDAVLRAVEGVTRREEETYEEFIERAAENPIAAHVKLADIRDNLDLSRIPEPTEKDRERLRRYQAALGVLLAEAWDRVEEESEERVNRKLRELVEEKRRAEREDEMRTGEVMYGDREFDRLIATLERLLRKRREDPQDRDEKRKPSDWGDES